MTNELAYDQRMQRICTSLAQNGYAVTLVGFRFGQPPPLPDLPFRQRRLRCWFRRGKLLYAEYNLRLFLFLLFHRMDAVCAIDLDTIVPCYYVSRLKGIKRVYDAHELFTGLKEVVSRPGIQKAWEKVERRFVPRFKKGYTVSDSIAEVFRQRYGVDYATISNMPVLRPLDPAMATEPFILYQGFVNEARGFEYLVPAMKMVKAPVVVCGDGNFMPRLKELIRQNGVEDKFIFKGMMTPEQLWPVTQRARVGIALAENEGLNQYLALPNKFFDYLHAGLPQVTMNYPEYRAFNSRFEVALLLDDLEPGHIASALNKLLDDDVLYQSLHEQCLKAREEMNWAKEEQKLLHFYRDLCT